MPAIDLRTTRHGKGLWPNRRGGLTVLPIPAEEHARFAEANAVTVAQTPAWSGVKRAWRPESIGWIDDGELVGAALVLHRPVPGTRRSLAYIPEGPTLNWERVLQAPSLWLDPMLAHLRSQHAFAVRIGPTAPVRSWGPATAKKGMATPEIRRFSDLEPDETYPVGLSLRPALETRGWTSLEDESGHFTAGQPRLGVGLPIRDKTPADLLKGMNQQWRRNVKRSAAVGVVVRAGGKSDLETFHQLYLETGERDGFTPRPLSYFTTMWDALGSNLRLWLSEFEGETLASAITVDVNHTCWYVYGGSTSRHREAQASTALQWASIQAALERGNWLYDFRGIADTLDEDEKLAGLLRFKIGTGARVVETVGEYEYALSPLWNKAFQLYQEIQRKRS